MSCLKCVIDEKNQGLMCLCCKIGMSHYAHPN